MRKSSINIFCAAISSLLLLSGCVKEAVQTLPQREWELVWSDDFTGTAGTSPDNAKWSFDIGTGINGWGNSELQYYTNRPSNAQKDGSGNLVITARSESYAGSGFTSARIKTKNLFEQSYGRFEARIKTPTGPGLWPAFWMLGSNIDATPWPQCGEIDIMEQRGQEPFITHGSVHGPGYSGANAKTKAYALANGRFDTDYHIYAIEWGENYIDYFVDNFLYQRITPDDVTGQWVYDHPFFIILNVAVGGNFVGFPTTGTPFPQSMYVDYVRVYKEK
ncbi:MAG: glycoside hydrolase family 16 protein [Chitinophagaceae bacterium]|jgi:beta-glucanase (GH16 family)|nr:glycoside hydrolase family 16 protein [Chitinophagaceae bacterium]MBK7679970.1 glycoside hydrolase family 16 protein [Chitinophagaceae bacterium]MBK9465656.1 glycoside hydrolase family 16 protein [Chitinophagaceae bacterium]MBK9660606.1 glycoside hydrolase family 16 protein [Chitinophagaceae bacterium]MBK9937677.1 glycoside hydrolase family 16 protein [Chitinophagaceae bacterium]